MCFYLYSPNRTICIKYTSELIFLKEDGSSTVYVDCLIENPLPDDPIDNIKIIYPNRLFSLYPISENEGAAEIDSSEIEFSDISSTFIDNAEGINWAYNLPGASVQRIYQDPETPSLPARRIFQQSDPSNPTKNIVFEGVVGENGELFIEESFTFIQLKLLYNIYTSVLTYNLIEPITNKARWIRLKFRAKTAAHNLHLIKHQYLRRLTNSLYFSYQIFGPHDVKSRFITYLLSFIRRCEDDDCSIDIVDDLKSLCNYFERDGLNGSLQNNAYQPATTIFEKLFIHINPGELERLTDIINQGAVKIAGYLPNIVFAEEGTINLYQWKVISDEKQNDFNFSILFQAKSFRLLGFLAPWIAIAIGTTALLLGILRLVGCTR